MQRFYSTLFLLLVSASISAQDLINSRRSSHHTFIYQISNEQARALYKNIWNLDTTYLNQLVDTFPADSTYKGQLPVGHYVFIKTVSGDLHCELHSVNNLSLSLLNNHRDLIMIFNDSSGNEPDDIRVAVRSRNVPFNSDIRAYRLMRSNKQGLVSAEYQGHVSYFMIERRFNNTFFVRTGRTISRTFPINHLISPFYYIHENVRRIIYGDRLSAPGIYHRIARIFKPKPHKGYIVFNKPKFKSDETVMLKGWITTRKGKPISKTVDVYLHNYHPDDYTKKLGRIEPSRKGAYQFEFQLADSLKLKLDNTYIIQFRDRKGNILLSSSFGYEDYELKQNTYSLRSEQRSKRKPAVLYLKGEDSNAMPLFDVRVEVLLKPTDVKKLHEQKVFVPDTLWFYQTRLEAAGETKISIPDSVMRPAALDYDAVVSFLNTENERTVETLTLDHDTSPFPISIEVVDDSLKVTSLDPRNPMDDTITLTWSDQESHLADKVITLPYAEKVNPFADWYSISYSVDGNIESERIDLDKTPDQLQLLAHRTADTLVIGTENPSKIRFRYFLFRNRNLIACEETASLFLKIRAKASDSYTLSVQYIWAGRTETREYEIGFDKRNLDITLDHPAIIYPGQKASFRVTVRDAFGKPVEHVDLTAYAITKKFQDHSSPSVPSFSKPHSKRAIFNEFGKQESRRTISRSIDWRYWRKILALDTITFYRFLFPDSGYFEHRVNAAVTQFAPFVVSRGDVLPVQVIYVDGQPVFYEGVSTNEPYSFHVTPGEHTIDLRLYGSLLTIQNVRAEAGQKLIFSIDENNLPDNCVKTKMPFRFSEEELKKLGRYFMVVRSERQPADAYLAQGNVYRLLATDGNGFGYSPRERLAGPFYPGEVLYAQKDGFRRLFDYEPFSWYEFRQEVLKIRQGNISKYLKDGFSWKFNIPLFDQSVQTLSAIEAYWRDLDENTAFSFQRFPDFEPASGHAGRLTLHGFPEEALDLSPRAVFVVDLHNPDNYAIFPGNVSNAPLLPGNYQAVLIFNNEKYLKADSLEVKAYGNNYYNLKSFVLHEPDSFSNHLLKTIRRWSMEENYITKERKQELQRAREFLYQQSRSNYHFDHAVTGRVVSSEDGEGLPGVNVIVRGTAIGTVTDMDGYYRISCPQNATLVFSFIGFVTEDVQVGAQARVDVSMAGDVQQLNEVVVVGMGVQTRRHNLSASVSTQLMGKVAGINISSIDESVAIVMRGVQAMSADATPLVILDGRIVRLQDIDKSRVTAIDVLKGTEATALFGSRASNGVILLSTQPGATKDDLKQFSKSMSSAAALENTPGNELRKNFRDYAFWNPALMTNVDGQAVFEATFPDDITGWDAHVLGMATKRRTGHTSSAIRSYKPVLAQIAQPRFLVEGDSTTVIGKITNYLQEPVRLDGSIRVNEMEIDTFSAEVEDSRIDSIQLRASGQDSIAVHYSVSYNDYSDGELRKIPVYRRGTQESRGQFISMPNDTTVTLKFDPSCGDIRVYAQADLVDVLVDEISFLKDYEYECNEQLASRLRALLLEKKIYAYRNDKFMNDREVSKVIRKLVGNQNKDGSWAWWETGDGSTWVTLHVIRALDMAEEDGFPVAIDRQTLINYLVINLSNLASNDRLQAQAYLMEQGEKLQLRTLADSLQRSSQTSLYDRLQANRLMQLAGETPDWTWINTRKSQTVKGNPYWGEERIDLFDNSVLNTIIVYKMIEKENPGSDELLGIANYFLEQRKRHWRNTYESSLILETILPRLIRERLPSSGPSLQLSGLTVKRVEQFPFDTTLVGVEPLILSKSGRSPVYFTAYQEHWNADPSRTEGDFVVSTAFELTPDELKAGKPVNLTVEVKVKRDVEYVMIEVPIPAGCTYDTKVRSRANGEVHREYYSHKTNIYCEFLKRGTYTYSIPLLPRYSGSYTINPAVVECMYFPVIYGREGVKRVRVE